MVRSLKLITPLFLILLTASIAQANDLIERKLSTLEILPSTEPLLNSEDIAIAFIDTGVIKNGSGEVARGPHTFVFSLSSDADYPLNVNDTVVQPGNSFSLKVNLTKTNHRVLMPVYPAAENSGGQAPYNIRLDNINVKACLPGYNEKPDSCFKVEHKTAKYHCPSDFSFRDGTKDCKKIDIIPLNLDCPTGMNQTGDTCGQKLEGPVELTCNDDEYAIEGSRCVKRTYHETLPCPEGSELTSGGQCLVTKSSKSVDSPCPETYLNTGYQCEKIIATDPITQASCPDNMTENEGLCYFEDGLGSSVSNGNYGRVDTNPYIFELKTDNYALIDSSQTCPGNYPNEHGYSAEKGGVICLSDSARDLDFTIQAEGCSGGYIQISDESGIKCLKESSASEKRAQCLSDQSYNLETGKCEGIDIKPYGDYCGENRTTAGECNTYSHEPQDIYCEAGLSYNSSKGSCEEIQQKSAVKSCQDGFSLNSSKTKCVKNISAELRISCDANYKRSSNGRYCYREYSQAANRYCDSGWSKSGTTCRKKQSTGVSSCPGGYTKRSGNCHRIVSKTYKCKWYQTRQGDKCLNFSGVTYYAYNRFQPDGKRASEGGSGVKYTIGEETTYDPKNNKVIWTIPAQTSTSGGYPGGGGGYPGGGGGMIQQQHIQKIKADKNRYFVAPIPQSGTYKYCSGDFTLDGDKCKLTEAPSRIECKDGATLRTGPAPEESKWQDSWGTTVNKHKYYCESKTNASYGCPGGSAGLNSSKCYKTGSTKSVGSCPSGYNLNTSNGNCERTLSKAANSRCPSGSEWTLNGTKCRYYNERSVNINCPSSYSKSGSECRKNLIVDPILSCDAGFKLNKAQGRCERTITTPKL